jgi:hypothetical protein
MSMYNSIFLLSLKIIWHYSCEYEYTLISYRETQRTFGITVNKLMELIRIFYKTLEFSTCRVDIYKFFFSILNSNVTLF